MSDPSYTDCPSDTESIEEEIEPKLKYKRLQNDLLKILTRDSASCIAVHPKFICLGTHWGVIHLLDHEGNATLGEDEDDMKAHTVSVNQISIDVKGDYLATCSDDGKIFVHGLCNKENNQYNIGRLIKTVALDPYYYKPSSGKRLVTGDDKLTLHEKTFLGRLRTTVLCESEGYVRSMTWGEHFIAWASDIGVRVFDVNARCSLGLIKWEEHPDITIDKFRCNLRWADSRTLLIGWVDTVRVCVIRKRSTNELANRDLPEHLVDPISTFKVDFYISGIAPLDHLLVLLGYPKERDAEGQSLRPQLFIVEYRDNDYVEVCTDSLSLRGYEKYTVNDYHLDVLIEENRFFIVAPKDIVVASKYDLDDRIQWLKNHGKYEEALEALMNSNNRENRRFNIVNFGIEYLDFLLSRNMFDTAAQLCLKIFGLNKALWEEHIFKFVTVHQLRSVAPYIPKSPDCKLDKHIYEMILYEYLKMDAKGLLKLVKDWPHELYNPSVVINAILEQLLLSKKDNKLLLEALALLYSYEKQYDKSLSMYLTLKNKDVFMLIYKHNLYGVIKDMIVELMNLDQEKAISLFLEKNRISSEDVVKKLINHEALLYKYLDAYDKIDVKKQYHGSLVKLYAIFDRDKLLPLLKRSENYPIQEALDICEKNKYYPEMVFLLARIGDNNEALQLIMQQLKDIQYAIMFCQEQKDPDLWNDLINHSIDKPEFITFLLQSLGTYMDPTILVEKIQGDMKIPGLKTSLVKMLCTYNLQVSVQEGCKKILVSDYFNLHEKLVRLQQRGVNVSQDMVCGACHRSTLSERGSQGIYVFNCRHSFHKLCLVGDDNDRHFSTCPICFESVPSFHITD